MLGVAINVLAVLLGTFLGMTIGRFLKEDVRKTIMQALGVCVVVIGVSDALKTNNSLLVILSVVIGGFLGSVLHISDGLDKLGDCLQKKISKNGESKIGEGFVSATMIFCVGAMTVYGSISAGLGDNSTLLIKSVLDGTVAIVLASSLGIGVAFSAIPILVLQGGVALLAEFIAPYATPEFLAELSGIGGVLVFCIGLNLLEIKKIKTADLLPAILGAGVVFLM